MRKRDRRRRNERGKEGKKNERRQTEKFLPFQYALRDILVALSWRVSTLISEILNAPIPSRKSDQDVFLFPSLFLLHLSLSLSLRDHGTHSRMHAYVHARVRTSSTLDNLGAPSSADVSSYLELKAMTLSPIRAIIHLSSLFSVSTVLVLPRPPSPFSSILHRSEGKSERERNKCWRNV